MKLKIKYGCEKCGKGVQFANQVSHAKNRTKIVRRPNLHSARIVENKKIVRMTLCTKCLRSSKRPPIPAAATA